MNDTPRPLCVRAMTHVGRPASSGSDSNVSNQRPDVVTVDLDDAPPERAPPIGERLEAHRALGRIALLQPVAVDDDRQVVEAESATRP